MIAHQKLLQVVERRGHPREIVEALVAAGADREYFADKEKLDGVAHALTTPMRTVTVERDEEHNRYLLHVEDRSGGYPRQHTIGVDFVTAGEYRTLLANHRDIPALSGDIIVSTAVETPDAPDDADETAAAAPPRKPKEKPADITLHSLDELLEFFIAAGKKVVGVNGDKGLGQVEPERVR